MCAEKTSSLFQRLGIDADVLFAGCFFLVVPLHPGFEAFARGSVFAGEGDGGDFVVADLALLGRIFRHQARVAVRKVVTFAAAIEEIAFDGLAVFQREGEVAAVVECFFESLTNFCVGGESGNPAFEVLVRESGRSVFVINVMGSDMSYACAYAGGGADLHERAEWLGVIGVSSSISGSRYLLKMVARTVAINPPSDPKVSFTALAS